MQAKLDAISEALDAQQWKQAIKLAQKLPGSPTAQSMRAIALLRLGRRQDALDAVEEVLQSIAQWAKTPEGPRISFYVKKVLLMCHRVPRIVEAFKATDNALSQMDSQLRLGNVAECQALCMKLARASTDSLEQGRMWLAAAVFCLQRAKPSAPPGDAQLGMAEALLAKADGLLAHVPSYKASMTRRLIALRAGKTDAADVATRDGLWALAAAPTVAPERARQAAADILTRFDADDWAAWDLLTRLSAAAEPSVKQAAGALTISLADKHPAKRGPLLAQSYLALHARDDAELLRAVRAYVEAFGDRPCCVEDVRAVLIAFAPPQLGGDSDYSALEEADEAPVRARGRPRGLANNAHGRTQMDLVGEIVKLRDERRWPMERVRWRVAADTRAVLVRWLRERTAGDVVRCALARADLLRLTPKRGGGGGRAVVGAHQMLRMVGEHEGAGVDKPALVDALLASAERWRDADRCATFANARNGADTWSVRPRTTLCCWRATCSLMATTLVYHLRARWCALTAVPPPQSQAASSEKKAMRAAAELEALLARSPHMYQARLLLAEVYGALLGAPMLAYERALGLGLKHIQLDSLFHWRLADISGAALGRAVVVETEAAAAANAKMIMESADLFAEAVGKASADGAADVLRLVVRLQRSLGAAVALADRFVHSLRDLDFNALALTVKIHVLDPAGFADEVPHDARLRRVALAGLAGLADNSDYAVQASWDVPFGAGFVRAMDALGRAGPVPRVDRHGASSKAYLAARLARMVECVVRAPPPGADSSRTGGCGCDWRGRCA